jgi:hypothetical protein
MVAMDKIELRSLGLAHRTLATAFLLGLGLAYAVALLFVFVQTEMKPSGIKSQFRGSVESENRTESLPDNESDIQVEDEKQIPTLKTEWKSRSKGMTFPKSLTDMILTTHLHLLAISMILFLIGGIFSFSSFPEKAKATIIGLGFIGLFATYACMWAVRYINGGFSIGVFCFGLLEAVSITIQCLFSLRDLWFNRPQL